MYLFLLKFWIHVRRAFQNNSGKKNNNTLSTGSISEFYNNEPHPNNKPCNLWCLYVSGWKSLSCVWTLWPHGLYSPWNSPGQNTGLSLLQGIFSAQGSNPGLPHYRQILYQLSHKGRDIYWGSQLWKTFDSIYYSWTYTYSVTQKFYSWVYPQQKCKHMTAISMF